MSDCFFCKVVGKEVDRPDIFFEDDRVFAMLDADWAVKGHTLVVWKRHVLNMRDLSEDDFVHFSSVCRKAEDRLLSSLGLDKSVVLKSGGLQPHFHFHIYPIGSSTPWDAVRDMIEKKTRHEPEAGEKDSLLAALSGI